jgi:hypothetical protein
VSSSANRNNNQHLDRHYSAKTQLLSAAAPALSSSVAVTVCLPLHVACCPLPPLFSCRRPRRRCHCAPLLLNQSSSPDVDVTISPLVPPMFVDCCFKRQTKPLLPTMVPSSSLVGCFRCPPPPTLAASHGRRHHQSVTLTAGASTSPSSLPGPPVIVGDDDGFLNAQTQEKRTTKTSREGTKMSCDGLTLGKIILDSLQE